MIMKAMSPGCDTSIPPPAEVFPRLKTYIVEDIEIVQSCVSAGCDAGVGKGLVRSGDIEARTDGFGHFGDHGPGAELNLDCGTMDIQAWESRSRSRYSVGAEEKVAEEEEKEGRRNGRSGRGSQTRNAGVGLQLSASRDGQVRMAWRRPCAFVGKEIQLHAGEGFRRGLYRVTLV